MSRSLHIEIQESAEELKRIMNEQTRSKFRERIQILYWIKTELFNSLQELADHLGRSKSVIFKWLKEYRTHGLTGLLQWNYHGGRRSKISYCKFFCDRILVYTNRSNLFSMLREC